VQEDNYVITPVMRGGKKLMQMHIQFLLQQKKRYCVSHSAHS